MFFLSFSCFSCSNNETISDGKGCRGKVCNNLASPIRFVRMAVSFGLLYEECSWQMVDIFAPTRRCFKVLNAITAHFNQENLHPAAVSFHNKHRLFWLCTLLDMLRIQL